MALRHRPGTLRRMTPAIHAVGDCLTLVGSGHSPSSPNLNGEIIDAAGRAGFVVYRVRWADGRESMLASSVVGKPATDSTTRPRGGRS